MTMLEILPWHLDLSTFLSLAVKREQSIGPIGGTLVLQELKSLAAHCSDSSLQSELAGDDGEKRLAGPGKFPVSLGDLLEGGVIDLHTVLHSLSFDEALAFGDTLIALHPSGPYGYEVKGWLYLINKNSDSAQPYLRQAAAITPRRSHPLVQLALCYDGNAAKDSVRAISRRALLLPGADINAIESLFESIGGVQRVASDSTDLKLLSAAAKECIATAKEDNLTAIQIDDANLILTNVKAALSDIRAAAVR